ncbi:MAG TPA: hypothetical protein VK439_11875 [Rubrivivax sp.]|nr:hypothetical protein [Rubrivivax sp.]
MLPTRRTLLSTLLLLAPVGTALAQKLVAGANGQPLSLNDAVARAQDGDTIELLPGDYRGGLVLNQRKLTLRGVGKVTVKGDGKLNGNGDIKALWTVRGGDVTIDNVSFRGARAADGGGAGVRQEGGRLTLRGCQLFDNEYGLLAINDERAEVVIDSCVFGMAPKVVGGLHHLLSAGRINKLSITGSRFQQGFEGHLIKSRARENVIAYNMIHDGVRGGASYEINLAEGGLATVIGNVIGQGADSQNPTIVAYGTEGRGWEKNTLLLAHNTLIHNGWMPAWFLRSFADRLPQGAELHAINNLLVGPGVFWLGASGNFAGNRQASGRMLRDIETYGFELPPGSMWRGSGVDPRQVAGHDLSPKREFEWPVGTRELAANLSSWSPGAYQR